MKLWLCLTLVCVAWVGLLLGLTQVVGLHYRCRLSARDHGSIEGENPCPTRRQFPSSCPACHSIQPALLLSGFLFSTLP
jgi:hypothetical protein